MSDAAPALPPDDDGFAQVVESFLVRFRRGERPALSELAGRHPEVAGPIRELLPALIELEQFGSASGSSGSRPVQYAGAGSAGEMDAFPERLGDYRILREIGGGGMGVVYEAEHQSLKSQVALKVMRAQLRANPKYLRRFHAEARLAAGLHHTNIVSVFDYGAQDGVCYYAMQFIYGQPLDVVLADIRRLRAEAAPRPGEQGGAGASTIAADGASPANPGAVQGLLTGRFLVTSRLPMGPRGPVTAAAVTGSPEAAAPAISECDANRLQGAGSAVRQIEAEPAADGEPPSVAPSSLGGSAVSRYFREVARLCAQVADALEYAHRRGVLHRDIKPSNLLLDALGNVWITDFGLAKLEAGDDLTQSRELVGTLRYMAPERFRGVSDRRGDTYSLGATLYELLTLQPPFPEGDQIKLIDSIRNSAPLPPRHLDRTIPRDLETIVLKTLAKEPNNRFGSAGELADELRRFVAGRPIRSRRVGPSERFWRWCKREPWLAGANVAAALLTTALAVGGTWSAIVYRGQRDQIEKNRDQIRKNYDQIQRAETATRRNLFEALAAQARATRFSRRQGQRFDALEALTQAAAIASELKLPRERLDSLRDEAIACFALPDLEPAGPAMTIPSGVLNVAFDRRLSRYALRFRDGTVSVRSARDDQELARFQTVGDRDFFLCDFSPDGRYLATDDSPSHALKVWDIEGRRLVFTDPRAIWHSASFRPDSRRVFATAEGKLHEYDVPTGRLIRIWPGRVDRAVFRPDGAQAALVDNGSKPPTCRVHEAESARLVQSFPVRHGADSLAWGPDGRTLAIVGVDWPPSIGLWDTGTGNNRATLDGHTNAGLRVAFHPASTLLASNGWESRLRLWDATLGQPLLNIVAGGAPDFSQDGRVAIRYDDKLTLYAVDPALEYRSLTHASRDRMDHARPSIRHDGRILAVGTDQGVLLYDLSRGTELALLPIGNAWHVMFGPAGDLFTSGDAGVQRWPIHLGAKGGAFRMGPPQRLPMPNVHCAIDQDRSGRIVALAAFRYAYVVTPERTIRLGPLDDCRGIAVSPDGHWLVTGSHNRGAQVWRIADRTKAADLSFDGGAEMTRFSPDGRWLAAGGRLWEVGSWREVRSIGSGACFSHDGQLLVVVDQSRILHLVELETGCTLARLESPDLCGLQWAAFSPDGARLVVTTNDGPATHVWDLRAIRKQLALMGLDWDAPAYSADDPADPSAPPLPALTIDYGPLAEHLEHYSEPAEPLLERYTRRVRSDPNDADAWHHRAHALAALDRLPQAIADLGQAIRLRPLDSHLRGQRGRYQMVTAQYDPAVAELEAALALQSSEPEVRINLAHCCNNRAWELAMSHEQTSELTRAFKLAQRALELAPGDGLYLNTMGVVLYRLKRYAKAITTLERARAAEGVGYDGFNLLCLAMAYQRLGHVEKARDCFGEAVRSMRQPKNLSARTLRELAAFRSEAEAALAAGLPKDVFAPAR